MTTITELPPRDVSTGRFVAKMLTEASPYTTKHNRVSAVRGKASAHQCVDCSQPAAQWSTIHDRSGANPWEDYQPRCVLDHLRYDRSPFLLFLWRKGEDSLAAKLTAAKVREIRALSGSGEWPERRLANRYGVSKTTIRDITHGRTWRWLLDEPGEEEVAA